jgi:hypothetical protein
MTPENGLMVVSPEFPEDPMIQLTNALKAWGTPAFAEVLKTTIEQMDADLLPLQKGLTHSDYTTGQNRRVRVLSVTDDEDVIHARTGVFYTGLVAGTHCEDNPERGAEEVGEYCEMEFDIDKSTAATEVKLVAD